MELDEDRLPSCAEVVPQAREPAFVVKPELDPLAAGGHGSREQRDAQGELRLGGILSSRRPMVVGWA
jgi:hypothetical protein